MSKIRIAGVVLVLLALLAPVMWPWLKTPIVIATSFGIAHLVSPS